MLQRQEFWENSSIRQPGTNRQSHWALFRPLQKGQDFWVVGPINGLLVEIYKVTARKDQIVLWHVWRDGSGTVAFRCKSLQNPSVWGIEVNFYKIRRLVLKVNISVQKLQLGESWGTLG
jgi:hypothetical protein